MATETTSTPTPPAGPAEGEFTLGSGAKTPGFTMPADMLNRLNSMATAKGAEPAAPAPAAEPAPAKPTSQPAKAAPTAAAPTAAPTTPAPKPEGSPTPPAAAAPATEPAKAEPKAEEGGQPPKGGPKQLREAYERAQAKVTELETTYNATAKEKAEAFAKLAKAEEQLNAYQKRITEEFEPLRKVHEETAKRLQEREEALRIRDYTATTEWHERYVKPIVDTQQEAVQFISELVANVEGREVPATQEHLNYIIGAPNANEAARRAEQLFGNQPAFTGTLVNYRTKLRALQGKQQEALKNAQLESAKWAEQQQATHLERQAALQNTVRESLKKHLVAVSDPEEQAAMAEGEQFADELDKVAASGNISLWGEKLGQARAELINKRVLETRNRRLAAENETLRKQLADYMATEPAVETRNGGTAPAVADQTSNLQGGTARRLQEQLLAKAMAAARQ